MGEGAGEPGKWWHSRTNMEKTLIAFSVLLTITFILTLVVGISFHSNSSNKDEGENQLASLCMTADCLQTVGRILGMMNSTVEPCDNFYEYACGQYIATHSVPLDYPTASVEHDSSDIVHLSLKHWLESTQENKNSSYTHRNAKILYNTCMEFDRPVELYKSIVQKILEEEKIGTWPILERYWVETEITTEQSLASLSLLGISIAFQIQVVPDSKNPTRYILKISPGGPLFDTYTEDEFRKSQRVRSFIETSLLLLGVSKDFVHAEAEEIITMEAMLIRLKKKADVECDDTKDSFSELGSERMSFTEMDRRLSEVNWTAIMLTVLSNVDKIQQLNSKANITTADVHCRKYIREYISLFEGVHIKSVFNYFGWRFVFSFIQHLGQPFYDLNFEYGQLQKDVHPHLRQPRWKVCLALVERYMLPVLSNFYRKQAVPGAVLKEKKKIATHVRSSLNELLSSVKWLEAADKKKIKQKVITSKFNITLAEFLLKEEEIEEWFSNLNLYFDDLIRNILRIHRFEMIKELEKLVTPPTDSLQWDGHSLISPPHLKFQDNTIIVHFDKLIPPYLHVQGPSYLNYGAFGTLLARDLLLYISSLNFSAAVDSEKVTLFWEKPKLKDFGSCSLNDNVGQYKKEMIDSALTEFTAIQASYSAYTNHRSSEIAFPGIELNHEQMFFLSYAQSLCEVRDEIYGQEKSKSLSSRIRVNYVMKNYAAFGKAFSCTLDSPMNPSSKCHIMK